MDDSKLLNKRNLTATQPHTFYRQLRVKDLSNTHKWWLEWDSNLRPYVRKSPNPIAEPSRLSFVSFLTIMIHLGKSCPNILPRTISADTVNTSNTERRRPAVRKSRYILIIGLQQCCPTRGPRAACGPPTDFMRPASAA